MSLLTQVKKTQQIWDLRICPIRNGIYFANDSVALLDIRMPWENTDEEIFIINLGLVSLERAQEFLEHQMTHLMQLCEQSYADLNLRIIGGEGSYGSEGFIALTEISTGILVWLVYLDCSNPFEKVSLSNGIVTATSNLGHAWHFPLAEPVAVKAQA
jgi:hypothetical protein